MKSLTLLIIALFGVAASAAERPGGFLGIPWGASPEEAKRILQKRPGVIFPENADDYRIELTGGSFAGQPATKWVIEFPERKFASASVTLRTEGNASAVYKEFKTQLTSKYGSATSEKRTVAGSSSGSKVRKSDASQQQPTGSMATWRFTPGMKEKSQILITAELSNGQVKNGEEQASVTIKYVNETLAGTAGGNGSGSKPAVPPVKKEDL